MNDLTIRCASGQSIRLDTSTLERLAATLRGELLTAESPGYDAARTIWNGMIDRRPALVGRARSAADVVRLVRFARERDLLVSVRGGGHNIAGNALADGAFLIDLSPMRGIRVDPLRRTATAEPGVTLGEFDRDTQAFGLATPLGINSTTGLAGLTLGGGYGWLSRRFGLTVDNLRSVDLVTADGALLTANESDYPDIFWAVRGGGGNFGIVTSFELQLHEVGPDIVAGLIVHPFDDAREILRRYRDVIAKAPDELSAWIVMRKAPPLPFLPPEVHGREVLVIATMFAGAPRDADRALAPLRAIGVPIADVVGPATYAGFQTAFDPLLTAGSRNYWKTHNFLALGDNLIDVLVEQVGQLPGPQCEIFLAQMGGAVGRAPADSTPYAGREARFIMNAHARWDTAGDDHPHIAWARTVYNATARFASGGAYVNFMTGDEGERVRAAYGPNYDRLAAIKAKYDPTNFFRVNQNIIPTPAVQRPVDVRMPGTTEAPRPRT